MNKPQKVIATIIECPECKRKHTVATSTHGNYQWRQCKWYFCRYRFKVVREVK